MYAINTIKIPPQQNADFGTLSSCLNSTLLCIVFSNHYDLKLLLSVILEL